MAILQFANNATSTLAQNITGVDTTIYLAAGTGHLFPTPTTDKVFYATIYNTSSTLWEIVLVTARSGDTLTVVRAQEGTTAQTWLVGDSLGMYPTAATMNQLIQIDQLQNGAYTVVQAGGTANALTCTIPSDLTSIPDGMTLVVKPVYSNTGATTLQVTIGSTVLSAVPIVKGPNLALEATDIPSAGYPVQLIYSAIYGAWVMQMPSTLISPPVPPTYTINYVAVGGGGGGAAESIPNCGGGGAGSAIATSTTGLVGTTLTITVGGGGATASSGSLSAITGVVTAFGGSPGGQSGGSSGNGYPGGTGFSYEGGHTAGGGGGGSAANGGNATDSVGGSHGGAGGSGIYTLITGIGQYFGGGGGGGGQSGGSGGGAGGAGGGGAGADGVPASPGGINTGGGGGGVWAIAGANGGSGVVILSVPTARYSGTTTGSPIITTSGSNTILQYNSSGTYTI
jgi:hypothetical protein